MMVMLAATTMLEIHTMAWSEPVFILLGMSGFILIAHWLNTGQPLFLVLSALAVGLAFIARYAGVAYLGTAVLAVLFLSRRAWTQRIAFGFAYGLIAALPMMVWVVRNVALAGTTTNRTLYLHLPSITLAWEALATFSSWLWLPNSLPVVVRGLSLLVFVVAVGLLYVLPLRNDRDNRRQAEASVGSLPTILRLFFLFIPVYGVTLLLSNSVLRAYTPMEGRILSPLFPVLLILVLYGCQRYLSLTRKKPLVRLVFAGIGVFFIGISLFHAAGYVQHSNANGLGFNGRLFRESETLAQLRALPATGMLYSNAPEAIYIHMGTMAEKLPRPVESATQLPNPDYAVQLAAMQQEIDDRSVLVVLFDLPWRSAAGERELIDQLGLHQIVETSDGKIYVATQRDGEK
jgi:4-amino-4-deoxy-L-arabinose transferase-like glycosyltransferase